MTKPETVRALQRKVERLEAQLKALHDFMQRDRNAQFNAVCRNADQEVRIQQAILILGGE